jgi:FMN phosphatase YigB (HAD superfamily)
MPDWVDRGACRAFGRAALDDATRVVSVDVFDTLLLRTGRPEAARYFEIGQRQLRALADHGYRTALGAEDLMHLRLLAARAAYRNAPLVQGVRDAGYDDILRLLCAGMGLPRTAEVPLRAAELEYEAGALRPNRALVDILERCHLAGKRLVCISDMYLPGRDIATLLRTHVPHRPLEAVYSSADAGVTKSSRLLFGHVAAALGVQPAQMVHGGDSRRSDCEAACAAGVRGFYLPRARTWRVAGFLRRQVFHARQGLL